MNYIREINAFYDWLETNTISDTAITLWHALMHINNKTGWRNEFTVALSVLETKTGLKKDALIRARKTLQKVDRISFKSRTGMQSAVYKIIPLDTYGNGGSENCVVLNDTKCNTNRNTNSTQTATQTASITKLNETKLNHIYSDLLEFWNEQKIIKHQELTPAMEKAIDKITKELSVEQIKTCMGRYRTILNDETFFFSYRWSLVDFLNRKNGIKDFLDDGTKWVSYQGSVKPNPEEPIIDRSNYKIKYVNED